jgi:outer membrane protein assembly factor BamB
MTRTLTATSIRLLFAAIVSSAACSRTGGDRDTLNTTSDSAQPVVATTDPPSPVSANAPPGSESALSGGHDWTRFGWDAARSSVSRDPTRIDATNVSTLERQEVKIDGTVDASAIYLHGVQVQGATRDVIFVTTSYGKTLAIDAPSGSVLWRFTPPTHESYAGTSRITNSTPVADPDRKSIYAAAPDGRIRKLAVADGRVLWETAITKLPEREKITSPLNFDRGHVIATTGGYIGDAPPYQGHVAILDAGNGKLLHVWNAHCSDRAELIEPSSCRESGSAIWGRAGAVVDTISGNLLVATGNGRWDGRTHWGDAVLELSPTAGFIGNYTPENTDELDRTDADLGSTSPVILGGSIIAQGGKDGKIRLLDRATMRGNSPHRAGELQIVTSNTSGMAFSAPAVLREGSETWLFAADGSGTTAWTFERGRLVEKWHNGNGGTSPVVAGGLLYVYDPGGALNVYDPRSGRRITRLECESGHWNSPIVVDGLIVVPVGNSNSRDRSGTLQIFRLRGGR